MKDKIHITISISEKDPFFFFHNTVASIIKQNNLQDFEIYVFIENQAKQAVGQEIERLKKHGINIVNGPSSSSQYILSLTNGTIISKTFLYKGIYFLKRNQALFVCPEYSFAKIKNKPIIATSINSKIPYNNVIPCLLDRTKTISKNNPLLSSIIKDTCSAHTTTSITQLKKQLHYISLSSYSSRSCSNSLVKIDSNAASIISTFKKLCNESKIFRKTYRKLTRRTPNTYPSIYISDTMRAELEQLSNINLDLKIYKTAKFYNISKDFFKSILFIHNLYLTHIRPTLRYENYDYIILLPWLIHGGIDLFAINYVKYIAKQLSSQNILVILTEKSKKSLTDKELNFPKNVDIIYFSRILQNINLEKYNQESINTDIIYSLINIFIPSRLHIMASKDGYNCLIKYNNSIRAKNIKIIFSSYNFIIDKTGEYLGYTVNELPKSYKPGDIITTDNIPSKNFWVDHYGFDPQDILIHKQLFLNHSKSSFILPKTKPAKILWAAHVRPEKNPEILIEIVKQLQSRNIEIHCYGMFDPQDWPNERNPLTDHPIKNLYYHGAFSDFFHDINLSDFSLFLYTSHTDGTPNIILEAALYGIPIVASSVGGIPDILVDNGYLVKDTSSVADFVLAINEVLSNPEKAINKARKIQIKLAKDYNELNFNNQVKDMLSRSK